MSVSGFTTMRAFLHSKSLARVTIVNRVEINYHPQSGWFDSKGPPPCGRGLPPEVLLLLVFFLFLLVADENNGV